MATTPGLHFDGDFSLASQVGLEVYECPFPTDPRPYLMKVTYWQDENNYITLPLDSIKSGKLGVYFHAGESNFQDLGSGIISFVRTYAALPRSRPEFFSRIHGYQLIGGDPPDVIEIATGVNCRAVYDYFHTLNPDSIPVRRATRFVKAADGIYRLGPWPPSTVDGLLVAEDSTHKQWMGNIYERVTLTVPLNGLVLNSPPP